MKSNITPSSSSASSGPATISQLSADPASPTAEQAWVLATQAAAVGSPMGLLLSLTNSANTYTYQLRYKTIQGTVVGTPLT